MRVTEISSGDGWKLETVLPVAGASAYDYGFLVPRAAWLWGTLERHCVQACCGMDAFDISHRAVRWACGDDVKWPGRKKQTPWRNEKPGDAFEVARQLRDAASELRSLDEPCVFSSVVFGVFATPASHADLLLCVADWLEQPLPAKT